MLHCNRAPISVSTLSMLLVLAALAGGQGCPGTASRDGLGSGFPATCPPEVTEAPIDVGGVFRYRGERPLMLSGTITFEQDGPIVRVLDTTYDFTADRRLEGQAALQGNRLNIRLVPRNGDTDYRAEVTFLFTDDGSEFCVEFNDTNGDAGNMGSYRGWRVAR